MGWSRLSFGIHKGKTLPEVMFKDPDWFFWAYENKKLNIEMMMNEAEELFRKARAIRLPGKYANSMQVAYLRDITTGKFAGMQLVVKGSYVNAFSSCSDVIDLSFPRSLKSYDKQAYKSVISMLKQIFWGNSRCRINRLKAEEFFNNNANFKL